METTRYVSMVTITLSTRDLNSSLPGYQVPLNIEHTRQQPRQQPRQQLVGQTYHQPRQAQNQYNDDYSYARGRGRGRGRGRDYGRGGYGGYDGYGGYGNYEDEGNWSWFYGGGRGRGWNYHGRGRDGLHKALSLSLPSLHRRLGQSTAVTEPPRLLTMALLLGEDGRGYELARRLESCGAWRAWLGDAAYAAFAHSLSSAAAWDAFMSSSSGSRSQLLLKLRARALLFDKASASLFLRPSTATVATQISDLNPSYLQLHEDELYCSLEDEQHDGFQPQTPSRPAYSPHRASQHSFELASSVGYRYNDPEHVNTSKYEYLLDKCYSQYAERYRIRNLKFPFGEKESHKRSAEGMYLYSKLRDLHKRKRQIFKDHRLPTLDTGSSMHSEGISERNKLIEEDISFFPEIMFTANCVPESALPLLITDKKLEVEVYGVLDNLPTFISPSPAMMERFGVRPEYIKMGNKYRGKGGSEGDKRPLTQEQASQMAHKAVTRLLISVGFEGGTEVSMKIFSDFFSSHISKLGRNLKLLTDNYKKQVSSIELLKMFLQISGHGNLLTLAEITKNSSKVGFTHQTQQTVRQLPSPQQNPLLQAQHFQRQMHPQMNMLHPQNIAFQQQQQQQWDKLRRRQVSTRGSVMDQPMTDVKIENIMEGPIDTNNFNALNKQQMQLRQQQQMAMANHPTQSGQHFKQLQPSQIPQLQAQLAQNAFNMRNVPVKVEAFQELMSGDSTLKHEPDQNKLNPPTK